MTKIKLRNLLLLVRPNSNEQKEEKIGSIIIPVTVKGKPKNAWGEVIAVGDGNSNFKMEVHVGDLVSYDPRKDRITIDGCLLMDQEEIQYYIR